MTSPAKTRVALGTAQVIAWSARLDLAPYCDLIEIAGSIRRRKGEVADVELVVIPQAFVTDLFGTPQGDSVTAYLSAELTRKGSPWALRLSKAGNRTFGRENKLLTFEGFPVDVFTATEANYGRDLLIRTGPFEWNIRVMRRFRELKCRGHAYGPHAVTLEDGTEVDARDEETVFKLLQWDYVKPEERV